MSTIENALGKRIQITNSPIYCQLNKKIDLNYGMDYESLLMSISNLAHTMGRYMGADIGKMELYIAMMGLGKIDGGKPVFDYINSNIQVAENKIHEIDVMMYNLKKIFPDLDERFNKLNLEEISELFSKDSKVLEIKIIKLAFYLKLISQNLKKNGKLDENNSTDFIFGEMGSIINNYQQTKNLEPSSNIFNLASQFYNQSISLDREDIEKLDRIIQNYNSENITKNNFIEELKNFEVIKEKKNKVR